MRRQVTTLDARAAQAPVRPRAGAGRGEPADHQPRQPQRARRREEGTGQLPADGSRPSRAVERRGAVLAGKAVRCHAMSRARGRGSDPGWVLPASPGATTGSSAPAWTGNEQAWAALIDKYKNLIYSIPLKYGASQSDAADIFQSVCLELFAELPRLRQSAALRGWLMTVTAHQTFHTHKKQRRRGEAGADRIRGDAARDGSARRAGDRRGRAGTDAARRGRAAFRRAARR